MDVWWAHLPLAARRVSRLLFLVLTDGLYCCAWPAVGAVGPPASFLLGALLGRFHTSFAQETFTSSLPTMVCAAVLGYLSAAMGFWLAAGFALGDLLLFDHRAAPAGVVSTVVRSRAPLLIEYALLFLLVAIGPVMVKAVRRRLLARVRLPRRARLAADAGLQAVLSAGWVLAWVHAAPTLIRPVYTWQGSQPPIGAIQPVQATGWVVVAAAALAAAARIVLEYRLGRRMPLLQRLTRLPARRRRRAARTTPGTARRAGHPSAGGPPDGLPRRSVVELAGGGAPVPGVGARDGPP